MRTQKIGGRRFLAGSWLPKSIGQTLCTLAIYACGGSNDAPVPGDPSQPAALPPTHVSPGEDVASQDGASTDPADTDGGPSDGGLPTLGTTPGTMLVTLV